MKHIISVLFLLVTLTVSAGTVPKYIFLFIGDGMSMPQRALAEEFSKKQNGCGLLINAFPVQGITETKSASSLITDSAAAATAIACGEKTVNGRLGIDSTGTRKIESVAEFAKKQGRKVGIVTSVTMTHATPAGFYAHQMNRNLNNEIAADLAASGFDYFGGGGCAAFSTTGKPLAQNGTDLYEVIRNAGYKVLFGRKDFDSLKSGGEKNCIFASDRELKYAIDRKKEDTAPTLADFTRKGIELLDNPSGFFMMVEGGSIDWAAHNNDAATVVHETIDFDNAVKVAFEFAGKHPGEVLIAVTGDHETGGMTLGCSDTGYAYYPERLSRQKCSGTEFNRLIEAERNRNRNFSFDDAGHLLAEYFGLALTGENRISRKDEDMLKRAFAEGKTGHAAAQIVSRYAGIGWTSDVHTGVPVLTTGYGCKAEIMSGYFENTEIAKRLKSVME